MIDLDRFKEHRDNIVMLALAGWIGFLIVLQLMASAVEGFPKLKKAPPEPPVIGPMQPRSCTVIDGIEICPKDTSASHALTDPLYVVDNSVLKAHGYVCAYHANLMNKFGEKRGKASPEAIKTIELVSRALEVDTSFRVYSATFERSPIAYVRNGFPNPEIVYDRALFPSKKDRQQVKWEWIKVAGHEVAHHKLKHTVTRGRDSVASEASADYEAGKAVYRLSGSLENALEITDRFGSAITTHPSRNLRRAAIAAGWIQARDRYNDPSNQCHARFISQSFIRDEKTCKMAVTCDGDNRPIKIACETEDKWNWSR